MNFQDYQQYRNCENTYLGTLSHYDALSNIVTHNQDRGDGRLSPLPARLLSERRNKVGAWLRHLLPAHYAYLRQGVFVQGHPAGDTGGYSTAEALQYAVRDVIGPKRIF